MPTLLVVDDSVTVQRVIALTFAEHDVQVVAVSDPHQAMERMRAQKPDLVLVASVLTQISGYDLARWMRNTPELQEVPVLLLVGAFEAVDEAKLAGSGANGIIDKPIEPTIVINRVKELLGLKAEIKPTTTGRLITSAQGPRDNKPLPAPPDTPASSVPDNNPTPAAAENAFPGAEPPRAVTSTIGTRSQWEQLRDRAGLEAKTRSVEDSSTRADGYLARLDAAFQDLDQQLAGRAPAMPGSRDSVGSLEDGTAAIDPRAEREIEEDLRSPDLRLPPAVGAPHPIVEVHEDWFAEGDQARATKALEQEQLAAEMGIHDVDLPEPAPGPASAAPTSEPEQPAAAVAQSDFDALDALPEPATAPYTPPASVESAPETREAELAPVRPEESSATPPGELMPPLSRPAPVVAPPAVASITDEMLDHIAARVAERLSAGMFGDRLRDAITAAVRETVRSAVADTSERIVRDEIDRIRSKRQDD